ncbi:MAG TPA: FecR domain-containing protein [Candidatus Sulfotelmatobacter sp.]|jgi:hypothetical protein
MEHQNENPNPERNAAHDDYLWDGSGAPDPDVQKLEVLLKEFRHHRPALSLPALSAEPRRSFFRPRIGWLPVLAGATAAALVLCATLLLLQNAHSPDQQAGWSISSVAGTARIGTNTISGDVPARLDVGQTLETGNQSHASLNAENVGLIELDAGTRLRLLAMGKDRQRIALDRGTIHAHIWAPPGQFIVDTPAAITVDLGCAYTLKVDDSGAGIVRTSLGWVGFKLNGREAFIPAGAACATRPKIGPGTPYFENAPSAFRAALERFDFTDSDPQQRAVDLNLILSSARPHDALTLWHLLSRVDAGQRGQVYDKLEELALPPADVTKDGILQLNQPMLDSWWNSLGFDDISVWRHWEHSWAETSPAK